jgi:hypothetical protein
MIVGPTGSGLSYNSTPPMPAASPWPRLLVGPVIPALFASQRDFRSRVWREEEQGVRACARLICDLYCRLLSARTPCSVVSGSLRRLLDQFTSRRDLSCAASLHPDPGPALGRSIHQRVEAAGLPSPAPVLSCGSRTPRFSSPGHANRPHPAAPVSIDPHTR